MHDFTWESLPYYTRDGLLLFIASFFIPFIWQYLGHPGWFHTEAFQHFSVWSCVAFVYCALFFPDALLGFLILRYQIRFSHFVASCIGAPGLTRLVIFLTNVVAITIIYKIGAKYYDFNTIVNFRG